MVIYSLMFFLCVLLSFYAERKRRTFVLDSGETVVRPAPFFVVLSAIPLVFFAGMRDNVADTSTYIHSFNTMTKEYIENVLENVSDNKDVGFKVFTYLVKQIWDNYTFWLFIIATFCVVCLWVTFYKYSDSVTFSIFLFFGTTSFSWIFNGMRQYIAVAGLFAMFPLLLKTGDRKKDTWKCVLFILGTLLLSTIHMTALIILPIFFLCRGEILNRIQMLFVIAFVGFSMFITPFTDFLVELFSDTQYSSLGDDIEMFDAAHIARLLIVLIPIILGLYRINQLRAMNDPVVNFCYNMSLLNACLMVPAVTISGNVFARFAEYCNTFNLLLYPIIINRLYGGKTRRILSVVLIFVYIVWFYYQMELTWNWPYGSEYLGTFN